MLAGGLGPENVARGDRRPSTRGPSTRRARPSASRGSRTTTRVRAWVEAARDDDDDVRRLRRPLRPRDADPGARRADRGLGGGAAPTTRFQRELHELLHDLRRPADAAHARRAASRPASASTSSARTCSTPARTSSTTRSARRCSRAGSASAGSSPRPAPASTASRPRRSARASASSASSTWAPRTCAARRPNVERMHLLGAEVRAVEFGTKTLKEATSEAIRDWITNVETTHYLIGSCVGPAPYPELVARAPARDRRRGARADARRGGPAAGGGRRLRRRRLERDRHLLRLPRRRGRAAGRRRGGGRRDASARAAPACCTARAPRCSPTRTARSPTRTRSRPGSTTRASAPSTRPCATPAAPSTSPCTDDEALAAFHRLARTEGIIPALESSHALARALDLDAELVLVCLSGRGDKDLAEVLAALEHR